MIRLAVVWKKLGGSSHDVCVRPSHWLLSEVANTTNPPNTHAPSLSPFDCPLPGSTSHISLLYSPNLHTISLLISHYVLISSFPSCLLLSRVVVLFYFFSGWRAIKDYLKLATAGAACNALVRFFLHPVDCVKTTVQAEMGRDIAVDEDHAGGGSLDVLEGGDTGWIGTVKGIIKKGGLGELTRGIDVSTVSRACGLERF